MKDPYSQYGTRRPHEGPLLAAADGRRALAVFALPAVLVLVALALIVLRAV